MRVGFLGAGRIGAFHAEILKDHPDVGELIIGDADPQRARTLAEKLDATAADSVDAVFDARPDAVCIAAATAAHAELIHKAADAGIPTFCEKPIALDVAGTLQVLEHVRAAGIPLHIGFQRRFDAGYRAAREALAAGQLGTLHRAHVITADPAPPHPSYVPTSGGIYRDCHIHDFDIIHWVTGRDVVEVFAVGANRGADFFRDAGDVDTSLALLRLDDDTLVTVQGSRYNGAGYDVRMELAGTEATLVVGLDERAPLRSAEPGVKWPSQQPYVNFLERFANAYVAELNAFVDMAAGRIPSPCTGEEALEALYVAEACDLSRREGRPVRVAEVRA
ncbi:dehydrogenase [Carbonactinospora thermoautotrophica]|uniref:Dehydrogenase n=1 Tax=Carbonactinospora thermoautotrophica TaxID=1469144 RepID=A0A132NDC5_9ACTN|nr:Gfo/Idh/MocA family oxidoreductase [Carbonactinospora thermoautotrophica]KWX01382.1 hypothetical protein LI90_2410 [Carbonactinospora thermoautotrophica]KWX05679.1 dehydrogenase [Carbonactinospora thermoautotrophica]KWX08135.1 dehydrogenase [Carbonactinospora thermoautotrophica]